MITGKSKIEKVFENIIINHPNLDMELNFTGIKSLLCRYGNNIVHQHMDIKDNLIQVRIIKNNKIGMASCNKFDEQTLNNIVKKAINIAENQSESKIKLSFASDKAGFESSVNYCEQTANITTAININTINQIIGKIKESGLRAAGKYRTDLLERKVINSNGLNCYGTSSQSTLSVFAHDKDISGFCEQTSKSINEIECKKVTSTAIKKALDGKNPIELNPGKYDVILEPNAVVTLLRWLSYIGFGSKRIAEKHSYLTGKLNKKIMGDNVTIYDDAITVDKYSGGFQFDWEGTKKQKIMIIEKGIAKNFVTDNFSALKNKTKSTGHAIMESNEYGALPTNLRMKPGNNTKEEMINQISKGLLITKFHYVNGFLNPAKALMTGMTRDGTFLIENGEISKPVKNIRFTQSIEKSFNNIIMISKEVESIANDFRNMDIYTAPTILIKDFTFTN